MEKKEAKAIVDPKTAGEESPVPVQAPIEAPVAVVRPVHSGVLVREGGWDPYESEEEYVPPANPYETSIVDKADEVTRVFSPFPCSSLIPI